MKEYESPEAEMLDLDELILTASGDDQDPVITPEEPIGG